MDKASIVGDAVLYVQNLQMQAKKLKAEIAGLESSLTGGDKSKGRTSQTSNRSDVTSFYPIIKKVLKVYYPNFILYSKIVGNATLCEVLQ